MRNLLKAGKLGLMASAGVIAVMTVAHSQGVSQTQTTQKSQSGQQSGKPAAIWIQQIRNTREQTVANIMRQFRRAAGNDSLLTRVEMDKSKEQNVSRDRSYVMQRLMALDKDGDMRITRAELNPPRFNSVSGTFNRVRRPRGLEKLDANKDGVILFDEAYKLLVKQPNVTRRRPVYTSSYSRDVMGDIFKLLPKQQRSLSGDQLEEMIRTAFNYYDVDGDGVLRGAENRRLRNDRRVRRTSFRRTNRLRRTGGAGCAMPRPGARDQIVLVSYYKSQRMSPVRLINDTVQTGVTTFNIEAGDRPLYVVVRSESSNIVKFTGATDRLAHVVAMSQRRAVRGPAVGVVGVDRAKTTFLQARDCFGPFIRANSAAGRLSKSALRGILGREPGQTIAANTITHASLPSGKMQACTPALQKRDAAEYQTMCGFPASLVRPETKTSKRLRQFAPAGLADIKPADVVSVDRARNYRLLPHYAGLQKLIKDGAIEELPDTGYLVKRYVDRLPSGLVGPLRTKFVFKDGIKPPLYGFGQSCFEDEKGNPIGNSLNQIYCRR